MFFGSQHLVPPSAPHSVPLASTLPGSIENRENRRDERESAKSLAERAFPPNH